MKIRQASDFKRVLKQGRSHRNQFATLHILFVGKGKSRLGVIASRRTGSAVIRNRAKRLFREAFRLLHPSLPEGTELVVVAKASIAHADLEKVKKAFQHAVLSQIR